MGCHLIVETVLVASASLCIRQISTAMVCTPYVRITALGIRKPSADCGLFVWSVLVWGYAPPAASQYQ